MMHIMISKNDAQLIQFNVKVESRDNIGVGSPVKVSVSGQGWDLNLSLKLGSRLGRSGLESQVSSQGRGKGLISRIKLGLRSGFDLELWSSARG